MDNYYNLQIGDIIKFKNARNYEVNLTITRISEKSCWTNGGRNSWNTINSYFEQYEVDIIKP